jgi:hypothetical protein
VSAVYQYVLVVVCLQPMLDEMSLQLSLALLHALPVVVYIAQQQSAAKVVNNSEMWAKQ